MSTKRTETNDDAAVVMARSFAAELSPFERTAFAGLLADNPDPDERTPDQWRKDLDRYLTSPRG